MLIDSPHAASGGSPGLGSGAAPADRRQAGSNVAISSRLAALASVGCPVSSLVPTEASDAARQAVHEQSVQTEAALASQASEIGELRRQAALVSQNSEVEELRRQAALASQASEIEELRRQVAALQREVAELREQLAQRDRQGRFAVGEQERQGRELADLRRLLEESRSQPVREVVPASPRSDAEEFTQKVDEIRRSLSLSTPARSETPKAAVVTAASENFRNSLKNIVDARGGGSMSRIELQSNASEALERMKAVLSDSPTTRAAERMGLVPRGSGRFGAADGGGGAVGSGAGGADQEPGGGGGGAAAQPVQLVQPAQPAESSRVSSRPRLNGLFEAAAQSNGADNGGRSAPAAPAPAAPAPAPGQERRMSGYIQQSAIGGLAGSSSGDAGNRQDGFRQSERQDGSWRGQAGSIDLDGVRQDARQENGWRGQAGSRDRAGVGQDARQGSGRERQAGSEGPVAEQGSGGAAAGSRKRAAREPDVEIVLDRNMSNFEYGFVIVPDVRADEEVLVITWIDAIGQMGLWNRTCEPHLTIKEGDRIVSVNGVTDAEGMRTQLLAALECRLHIIQSDGDEPNNMAMA